MTAHKCAVKYASESGPNFGCDLPANRRDAAGKWLCRKHLQAAKARAAAKKESA